MNKSENSPWFFAKFCSGILLMAYSWLFSFYAFIQAVLFILIALGKVENSGSWLENSLRWFYLHPLAIFITLIMTIPGFLITFWDDISKSFHDWKRKRNDLYIVERR